MRNLNLTELDFVTGAGCSPEPPSCDCDYESPSKGKRRKNNNGYGNGPESGPPPGRSGDRNPQLTGPNRGPRGPR